MRVKELKKNDKVYFKSKTGEGSIVEVKSKGHYFMPAKANMRLKGRAQPLINNEVFTYVSHEILSVKANERVIKLSLIRDFDGTKFMISESELFRNFGSYL